MRPDHSQPLLPRAKKTHSRTTFYILAFFTLIGVLYFCADHSFFKQLTGPGQELEVGGTVFGDGEVYGSDSDEAPAPASAADPASALAVGAPTPTSGQTSQSSLTPPQLELEAQPPREIDLPPVEPRAEAGAGPSSSAEAPNRQTWAKCNDPENGFEAKVAPCMNFRRPYNLHQVKLTFWSNFQIPLMLDSTRYCKGAVCNHQDTHCCAQRRPCLEFPKDVPDACPQNTRANPYTYAFCQSIPCTIVDVETCCMPVTIGPRPGNPFPPGPEPPKDYVWYKGLYERMEDTSKSSRVRPEDKSESTIPPLKFNKGQMTWFDMDKNGVEQGTDSWAPLVNFMAKWGPDFGWKTEAWMKFKKADQVKYKQAHSTLDGQMLSWVELAGSVELQQLYP